MRLLDNFATELTDGVFKATTELSMATLQGYFLLPKKDPRAGVNGPVAWLEVLKKEQEERVNKRAGAVPLTPISDR